MDYNQWKFPYVSKGRFANYPGEKSKRTFWRAIESFAHMLFLPPHKIQQKELASWHMPYNSSLLASLVAAPTNNSDIIWIGHSTFLLRIGGLHIITDPIFDTLSYFLTFKRLMPPAIALENLPKIDIVLISHNHPDHMDESSLLYLKKRDNPLYLVPHNDKLWFDRRGYNRVKEFMWWDTMSIDDITCTFLPAIHWSRRGLFDHNRSLWGAWMIENYSKPVERIFFAGDTAYGSHFKAISAVYPSIDVALLPIGPAQPTELMRCAHMNAEDAAQAFIDLNARTLIPMHWGTYRLGTDHPLDGIKKLQEWWQQSNKQLHEKSLFCLKAGQPLSLATQTSNTLQSAAQSDSGIITI